MNWVVEKSKVFSLIVINLDTDIAYTWEKTASLDEIQVH